MKPMLIITLGLGLAACAPAKPVISEFVTGRPETPVEGTIYSLPLAKVMVTVDSSNRTFTASPVHYPDTRSNYILHAQFGAASKDVIAIQTKGQLLTSINATVSDQTDEIVTTLVNSSIPGVLEGARTSEAEMQAFDGSALIDPYRRHNGPFRVSPIDPTLFARAGAPRDRCPEGSSVCVPLLTPVNVTFKSSTGVSAAAMVMVPDPTRVIGIDLRQAACDETKNALMFSDGVMTKYDVTRPSSVAACLSIPLDIVATIIKAPIDALTGRTSELDAEKGLIEAQTSLLEAQAKLVAAQQSSQGEGN